MDAGEGRAPGAPLAQLDTVVAPSATDVWAFGWTRYAQHWNGTGWKRVALPVPKGAQSPEFHAAAAVSPSDIWAVGDVELGGSTPPAQQSSTTGTATAGGSFPARRRPVTPSCSA